MLETIAYSTPIILFLSYLANKYYFSGGNCKSRKRLDGKVVIVTGSNTGIGYEAALELAMRGATTILACRDVEKAQEACDKIKLETNNSKVFVHRLDLSSLESVRDFAANFKRNYSRLDILINNAGISGIPYTKTKEGFEMHFGVMHLGHFLLTNLLLDTLKSSAPSRIVNVSSMLHKGIDMNWADIQSEKSYNFVFAYAQAKLANILFTVELAKRYGSDGITSVCLHPGCVRTGIWREFQKGLDWRSILFAISAPFYYLVSKGVKQGAQTTIHCAIDDSVPEHNGKYFIDCQLAKCSPEASNEQSARRLWELSEKLVGLD